MDDANVLKWRVVVRIHLLRVRLPQSFKDKDLTRILQKDRERETGNIKMKNRNKTENRFKLRFVPIFHLPVPRFRSSRFSYIEFISVRP